MTQAVTVSPPAGSLPGHCEASSARLSYGHWMRDAGRALHRRYGTLKLLPGAVVLLMLLAGAAVQLGGGVYMLMKAQLAQVLIAHAWDRNIDAQAAVQKPWPWADWHPMAKLEIPRLGATRYVLDDDSGRSLAFGPGYRPASSLPASGGNTVISGHRDTHFSVLRNLRQGDQIRLQTVDGRYALYEVDHLQVVDESDTWVAAEHGRDELTLVTCWPFDALTPGGPERLIISAARVDLSTPQRPGNSAQNVDFGTD